MDVINKEVRAGLAPAGRQRETDADKGEAHNHVPSPDVGDWVLGLGDIEDDDPKEPNKECANHRRSEPARAFKLQRICLRRNKVGTVIFLLLTDT